MPRPGQKHRRSSSRGEVRRRPAEQQRKFVGRRSPNDETERRRRRGQEHYAQGSGECEKRKKEERFPLIKEEGDVGRNRWASVVWVLGRDGSLHGPPRGMVVHARK